MAAKKASADLDPNVEQSVDEGTVVETSPPPDTDPFPDQEGSTPDWFKTAAVSYTHLTLPTNREV